MARFWLGFALIFGVCATAQSHYFFVLPRNGADQPVRLVLNDIPEPDAGSSLDAATASAKFWLVDRSGRISPVSSKAGGEGFQTFPDVPADATALFGRVEYGVVERGQAEPVLIVHHPRACLGPVPTAARHTDNPQPLEMTPIARSGGLAFVVTAAGKPVGSAQVVVRVPDEKRPRVVQTAADGTTPTFEKAGFYSARSYRLEQKAGEFKGRVYKQVRHYATLTVRYNAAR
jgi:hypothetical protein